MSGSVVKSFTMLSLAAVLVPPATAQSVISARSGLVHFFEGTVYVAGRRLSLEVGRFEVIPDGGEIRTEQGRAEILLNPGVFLRMGENTAVRILDGNLENTRLELLSGAASIDCTQTGPGRALTVVIRQHNLHFLARGLYRIDSEPPVVRVREGRAEVAPDGQDPVAVEQGMRVRLDSALVPEASPVNLEDPLSDWSIARKTAMADDAAAAQNRRKPTHHGTRYRGPVRTVLALPGVH